MKISLAIHLLLFHAALVRPSSCLFVINTATSIAFELLDRPIVHGSQLIHAIVPVPPKATPADMILIKQELEGVDERFSVSLAFVITNKKFRPKWRNPAVNLHAIVPIPIQRNTLDLLSCEKHIESYLNLKERGMRYKTEVAFLIVEAVIEATE